jgi:hypothetical protein
MLHRAVSAMCGLLQLCVALCSCMFQSPVLWPVMGKCKVQMEPHLYLSEHPGWGAECVFQCTKIANKSQPSNCNNKAVHGSKALVHTMDERMHGAATPDFPGYLASIEPRHQAPNQHIC